MKAPLDRDAEAPATADGHRDCASQRFATRYGILGLPERSGRHSTHARIPVGYPAVMTNRNHRTAIRMATAALATGLLAGLAVAPAFAAPAPAAAPIESHGATVSLPGYQAEDLIIDRHGDDGVKGKIKNRTDHTVRVADPFVGTEGVYALIPPGGEITYYNSRTIDYRSGRDIVMDGEGASFNFARLGATGPLFTLTMTDPLVGRPDTLFTGDSVSTLRKGWGEGESHHEITSRSSFEIKREHDGWDGGYDNSENRDWAVFTVTINKI